MRVLAREADLVFSGLVELCLIITVFIVAGREAIREREGRK